MWVGWQDHPNSKAYKNCKILPWIPPNLRQLELKRLHIPWPSFQTITQTKKQPRPVLHKCHLSHCWPSSLLIILSSCSTTSSWLKAQSSQDIDSGPPDSFYLFITFFSSGGRWWHTPQQKLPDPLPLTLPHNALSIFSLALLNFAMWFSLFWALHDILLMLLKTGLFSLVRHPFGKGRIGGVHWLDWRFYRCSRCFLLILLVFPPLQVSGPPQTLGFEALQIV